MNCAEFEILLADYLDSTMTEQQRSAVEQHSAACAGCREFLADATSGLAFLKRAEPILPPSELITRIAYQAPAGRVKEPFEMEGVWSKLTSGWLQPMLRPRFAMGMAMTILSFAMLQRCAGVKVQNIQAADLNPARVWDGAEDKVIRAKDRAVKYYQNIKFVYQIESRLKDLQDQQDATAAFEQKKSPAKRGTDQSGTRQAPGYENKQQGERKQ